MFYSMQFVMQFLGSCAWRHRQTFSRYRSENGKDADSKMLLDKVRYLMNDFHYEVRNIDSTIILEEPKISTFIHKNEKSYCHNFGCQSWSRLGQSDNFGEIGLCRSREGCAAHAVVLLVKKKNNAWTDNLLYRHTGSHANLSCSFLLCVHRKYFSSISKWLCRPFLSQHWLQINSWIYTHIINNKHWQQGWLYCDVSYWRIFYLKKYYAKVDSKF